ncbi:Protein kinase superfamily protein [Abeliophyllum distichum]|uniref:Protein kinase superfamily protein n=1 Tax=Abeliophyllum distichum TaxID=126358 RepID=A0ABD1RG81_9LAMI
MRCFQFYIRKKKGEPKTTTLNSVQSSFTDKEVRPSFTDKEVRPSGSEFNSLIGSETSTESRGRSHFPNLSQRPSNLRIFTFLDLKQATKNFSRSSKLGEGGFGCVFKGVVRSSEDPAKKLDVAVKQLGTRGLQAGSLSF